MRTILTLITLFSLCGPLRAQPYQPSSGRELPRGKVLVYPSADEAAAADGGDNRYFTRLGEWHREGYVFSTAFTVPFAWANRQVIFYLEQASADYEVRVNGQIVAYDANGSVPAEYNLTRYVEEGRNSLEIRLMNPSRTEALESWKESPAPAIGQAWLLSQPTMRVRDVVVKTWRVNDADTMLTAEVGIVVKSSALNPRTSRIHYELLTPSGETAATGHSDLTLDMRREDTVRFLARIPERLQWSAQLPTQYTLRLKTQHDGRFEEYLELHPGFRTVETAEGRISVNGTPVSLRTLDVRPDITENEIAVLREQGYNTLRLLPGAVSPSLYDTCDRLGMYVIAQAPVDTRRSGLSRRPGGNPSNDPAWREAFVERARDSYHASKGHPSVIAFSLARESANGINLYEAYLDLKRYGDSRPILYPEAAGEWNSDPLTLE